MTSLARAACIPAMQINNSEQDCGDEDRRSDGGWAARSPSKADECAGGTPAGQRQAQAASVPSLLHYGGHGRRPAHGLAPVWPPAAPAPTKWRVVGTLTTCSGLSRILPGCSGMWTLTRPSMSGRSEPATTTSTALIGTLRTTVRLSPTSVTAASGSARSAAADDSASHPHATARSGRALSVRVGSGMANTLKSRPPSALGQRQRRRAASRRLVPYSRPSARAGKTTRNAGLGIRLGLLRPRFAQVDSCAVTVLLKQ